MKIITLDFETYYADDYSLSNKGMTTEKYVRDPRFETILVGIQVDGGLPLYVSGDAHIRLLFESLDIENNAVLCHHAHFDGLILSHHYGHKPKVWFDTLSMARALHDIEVGGSLSKLMVHYGVGEKGTEVILAKNKRLSQFSGQELWQYGQYCMNDCTGTRAIFDIMAPQFKKSELQVQDMVIRMFTEPALLLDKPLLEEYAQDIQAEKLTLLIDAGITLDAVRSDDKFAEALQHAGILNPPEKLNSAGVHKWAFAKTDKGLLELAEHESEQVQALVAARLGNKTTINESRALRMADMADRGPAPIYLKYSGAGQTHRLSGGDKMNWQNMQRGGKLRDAIYAPEGMEIVVVDSKNIDARCLDWLAMQEDALQVYREFDAGTGPDVYCVMASKIYNRAITPDDKKERFLGKQAKLQLGYQAGHERFRESCRIVGKMNVDVATAQGIVRVYRDVHNMVVKLWARAQDALPLLLHGPGDVDKFIDPRGLLKIEKGAILLPNGLRVRYPKLECEGREWRFMSGRGEWSNLYGGKIIADCVSGSTMVLTDSGWKRLDTVGVNDRVHDGIDFVKHGGIVFKSVQTCVEVDGVRMTPDHRVLTNEGWKPALEKPQPYRPNLRGIGGSTPHGIRRQKNAVGVPLRLRQDGDQGRGGRNQGGEARGHPELRLLEPAACGHSQHHSRQEQAPAASRLGWDARAMRTAYRSSMEKLRRAWHQGVQALGCVSELLGRYEQHVPTRAIAGTQGQQQRVFREQLQMGHTQGAGTEQAQLHRAGLGHHVQEYGHKQEHVVLSMAQRVATGQAASTTQCHEQVWDILDCGPLQRFVVLGNTGPFIVHNCCQALARIVALEQTLKIHKRVQARMSVHDEGVFLVPVGTGLEWLAWMKQVMNTPPSWAPDLPVSASGDVAERYGSAK